MLESYPSREAMAEPGAAGAVGRIDPLAECGRALFAEVAGRDGGVDRSVGGRLARGDQLVAADAQLGRQRVHEDVAILAGGDGRSASVFSSVASAEPMRVPPTRAEMRSAPAAPRVFVIRMVILALMSD